MLILAAAIAKADGNTSYTQKYMPLLKKWANYLLEKGLDPENQLCTDDFMGHLAHNTNLSLKAIIGIASYAQLCDKSGNATEAKHYRTKAEQMAAEWVKKADDGRSFRLAFDKPGTWSQKYNLVWDTILGLKLFPPEVAQKEVKRYADQREEYGTALDNRGDVVKIDWQMWVACLADSPEEFQKFLVRICKFLGETPDRVPMTDWYSSKTGKKIGFQARSVVGGLYIPFLYHEDVWQRWLSKN